MNQDVLIRWLIGGGIALSLAIVGVWARGLVAGRLARWMRKSPTLWDDLVNGAVSKQIPIWFLLLGIDVGVHFSLRDPGIKANVDRFIVAVLLFTMARLASSLVTGFIAARASNWPGGLPVTTLSQNVVRLSILGIGLLVALGHLGIERPAACGAWCGLARDRAGPAAYTLQPVCRLPHHLGAPDPGWGLHRVGGRAAG